MALAKEHLDDLDLDADLEIELNELEAELQRRTYRGDPVLWAQERAKHHLWSQQKKILESVRDYRRTAVKSCHEIGKSFAAALIIGWWNDPWPVGTSFVVTSAPTAVQVKAILWKEFARIHERAALVGRLNQTEWYAKIGDREELIAHGRKSDDYNPTAFQGIHAPRVLLLLDEACGVAPLLWEAGDSLIANDSSRLVVLGNPDDPSSEFARACKPGSGYHVVTISAFDSPNFTGEECPEFIKQQLIGKQYVEEKRRKWAPTWRWNEAGTRVEPPAEGDESTHPFWQSKVLGVFPEQSSADSLISIALIIAAQTRELKYVVGEAHTLGVDMGAGGDASTIGEAKGPVFRIIHEDHNPNTMATCGEVIAKLEETKATEAHIDEIGIGKGTVDRGVEQGESFVGYNVGRQAQDPAHFINLRAELYWHLRERFVNGEVDIDPLDEELASELVELRYKRLSSGKIQIESKDEMRRRGVASPNRAEAMMLAYGALPEEETKGGVLAGRVTW